MNLCIKSVEPMVTQVKTKIIITLDQSQQNLRDIKIKSTIPLLRVLRAQKCNKIGNLFLFFPSGLFIIFCRFLSCT